MHAEPEAQRSQHNTLEGSTAWKYQVCGAVATYHKQHLAYTPSTNLTIL